MKLSSIISPEYLKIQLQEQLRDIVDLVSDHWNRAKIK